MEFDIVVLLPALALFTLTAACIVALWSKEVTEKRKNDPNAPKSRLAADGPSSKEDEHKDR